MNKTDFLEKNKLALFAPAADFMPIVEEQIASGQSVEMSPRGKSMLPLLREGKDSVILSPVKERLKKYDIPLYRRADGSYVIHRIVDVKDGTYRLAGDNQYVCENGVKDDQIIAVVSAIRRGGKLIPANSARHKIYAILRHRTRGIRFFVIRAIRKVKRILCKKK